MSRKSRRSPPELMGNGTENIEGGPLRYAMVTATTLMRQIGYRSVECSLTLDQMMAALYPPDVIEIMMRATQYSVPSSTYNRVTFPVFGLEWSGEVQVGSHMILPDYAKCSPCIQPNVYGNSLVGVCTEAEAIQKQWDEVYAVLRWVHKNCKMATAKYYFGWIGSLLPDNHAWHALRGHVQVEPRCGVSEIADRARRAMTTVATGLLSQDCIVPTYPKLRFGSIPIATPNAQNS